MLAVREDQDVLNALVDHYHLVEPLLDRSFGTIPLVCASYPDGFEKSAQFHIDLRRAPNGVHTIESAYEGVSRRYLALDGRAMYWALHALDAVEFFSWSPTAADFQKAAYGRILLEPAARRPGVTIAADDRVKAAALVLKSLLADVNVHAIPLFDGGTGIAIWMPFDDAPDYAALRTGLHEFASYAAARYPTVFTTEPNTHSDSLVHLHVSKNSPGTFTVLPYSVRGSEDLPVSFPVTWNEICTMSNGATTVKSLPARLQNAGDVFASLRSRIPLQRFADVSWSSKSRRMLTVPKLEAKVHGAILTAAMEVLSDGRARTAEEIFADAVKLGLLQASSRKKYVYTALIEYIARAKGNGRKPFIVQDKDRCFRLNEPADGWPDIAGLQQADAPISPETQTLIDRLSTTASGGDPAAFESAVCDAFAHLGFIAYHVGGQKAPDGYVDAPLGVLGYRAMIECKTASGNVTQPDAFEAAKYRDAYGAQYCVLAGPAFADETELTNELQIHGVSAWTVGDLQTLLRIQADPAGMRPLFNPGYAYDALNDLLWERNHGARKRVQTIAALIRKAGWDLQVAAAAAGAGTEAPKLTVDSAMVLVDEALAAQGAKVAASREEVMLAIEWMTNPSIRQAIYADDTKTAIVICSQGS